MTYLISLEVQVAGTYLKMAFSFSYCKVCSQNNIVKMRGGNMSSRDLTMPGSERRGGSGMRRLDQISESTLPSEGFKKLSNWWISLFNLLALHLLVRYYFHYHLGGLVLVYLFFI